MECDRCGLTHADGDTCARQTPDVHEMTYDQLTARMQAIGEELGRLANRDDLSDDDERRWSELNHEFELCDVRRRNLRRENELRQVRRALSIGGRVEGGSAADDMDRDPLRDSRDVPGGRQGRQARDVFDLSNVRTFDRTPEQISSELRSRARSAIEIMPGMTQRRREAATQILERWDDEENATISRHVLLTGSPEYLRAFAKWARHGQNAVFSDDERRAVVRAMSLTDNAGGYLVPFQLDPAVIITSDGSYNEIRQIARVVMATGDVWHGVSAGATQWSWDPEATRVSDDTSTFAQPTVEVHKAQGFVPISVEALADAANVTEEIGNLLAEGKEDLEAVAFATGDGTDEPFGIVTALAGTGSEVDQDGAAGSFTSVDVYGLKGALPAKHRSRARWLANDNIYTLIRQFATADGHDLWERLSNDTPPLLLGKPTHEAEAMDGAIEAAGAGDNLILIIGNFNHYVIADRIGMTVELIPHLFQQQTAGTGVGMPTGQRGWLAWYRTGADSVHDGAFRMLNVTSAT